MALLRNNQVFGDVSGDDLNGTELPFLYWINIRKHGVTFERLGYASEIGGANPERFINSSLDDEENPIGINLDSSFDDDKGKTGKLIFGIILFLVLFGILIAVLTGKTVYQQVESIHLSENLTLHDQDHFPTGPNKTGNPFEEKSDHKKKFLADFQLQFKNRIWPGRHHRGKIYSTII